MSIDLSQYPIYKSKGLITNISVSGDVITVVYKTFDQFGNETDITDTSNSVTALRANIAAWDTSVSNLQAAKAGVQAAFTDAGVS